MTTMPLEMLGIRTPRGSRVHLYNVEGGRLETLCGRHIGVNSRLLGIGGIGPQVSADLADCRRCRKEATA